MSSIDRPTCFFCVIKRRPNSERQIDGDVVFEAACGHANHATMTWHPLCLMEFRAARDEVHRDLRQHGTAASGAWVAAETIRRVCD